MTELPQQIERSVDERKLLTKGERILVAVSGGLDSVVLLHVLRALSAKHRWRLAVAHFNHQLRGAESDADEAFVRAVAAKLGLRCFVGRGNVKQAAEQGRLSAEMAARKLRHDFLARTARRLRIRIVALAHHADDQVELYFLRLLRGAGGEGLAGMEWISPSSSDRTIRLIRPLLDQGKAALRTFAEEQTIPFREDSTNAGDDFLRNRIRNKLIPAFLLKYQPALLQTTLRTMEIVGKEHDFVRQAALAWLRSKQRTAFERLHPAVQRQVIQIQLVRLDVPTGFALIEKLRDESDCPVMVGPNLVVRRDPDGHVSRQWMRRLVFNDARVAVALDGREGSIEFGGVTIDWRAGAHAARMPRFRSDAEYFDADKVGSPIHLRHWQSGDRFRPIGMARAVKVQDLFVNQRIPRERRREAVVATTEGGEIFWVEGLRMAECFKLDRRTVHRLKWQWRR